MNKLEGSQGKVRCAATQHLSKPLFFCKIIYTYGHRNFENSFLLSTVYVLMGRGPEIKCKYMDKI